MFRWMATDVNKKKMHGKMAEFEDRGRLGTSCQYVQEASRARRLTQISKKAFIFFLFVFKVPGYGLEAALEDKKETLITALQICSRTSHFLWTEVQKGILQGRAGVLVETGK